MESKKNLLTAIWIAIGTIVVGTASFIAWHRESRIESLQNEIRASQVRLAELNAEWSSLEDRQTTLHIEAENERKHIADLQAEASQLLGVN